MISTTTIIRNKDITAITSPPRYCIYGPETPSAYDPDEFDQFEQRNPDDHGLSRKLRVHLSGILDFPNDKNSEADPSFLRDPATGKNTSSRAALFDYYVLISPLKRTQYGARSMRSRMQEKQQSSPDPDWSL